MLFGYLDTLGIGSFRKLGDLNIGPPNKGPLIFGNSHNWMRGMQKVGLAPRQSGESS